MVKGGRERRTGTNVFIRSVITDLQSKRESFDNTISSSSTMFARFKGFAKPREQ